MSLNIVISFVLRKEITAEHFSDEGVEKGRWFSRRLDGIWSIESQMVFVVANTAELIQLWSG